MIRLLAILAVLLLASWTVRAEDYPARSLRIIAPYAPGGQTDILARLIAQPLAEALGRPVVVENRPGANGVLGHDLGAKAPPDGATLLLGNSAMLSVMPNLANLPYDPKRDFAPVVLVAGGPLVLEVPPALPVVTVQDLIALSRQRPGGLNHGLGGFGTIHHLLAEMLRSRYGAVWANVPYRGSGPMLVDLMAGRLDLAFDNTSSSAGYLREGQLRAIAVTRRTPLLPGVPTLEEQGFPDTDAVAWHGVLAPSGTPGPLVEQLNAALVAIIRHPATRAKLADLGLDPIASSAAEFQAFILAENERWGGVIRASGTRLED
ncbi:Bug family tripartite tricarboxylate transporter substrate binding protein [Paracraurococcus lichenis]|uniref:Tripartite tricarboxylate transporter substrate binding protein n=1 Tax=Paracraurococcus lichenis TaxID=3064888 RepID=A0ABT9E5T5_9PROT|nr:tripartite tricarboxylate transporter substrate binding protein [Paracraurococcus sp. LOR1-02]MDO9711494.1 tripartite tricarboxylate transporter substrate binding protein [Paracraurococcus sp. LOR1-02]